MPRKQVHYIQSLARGLLILQSFSAERPTLTLTELSEITGFDRTAVQRFTDTLQSLGFLGRNRHKEFFLGPKVLSLGFAYINSSQLRKLTASYIDEYADRLGCTMNLEVLDDLEAVFLHRREVRRYLQFDIQPGSKLPAHLTSGGRVLLAALEDDELQARLARMDLRPVTSESVVDPQELWDELLATRQRALGVCVRQLSLDLYTVAAPLLNAQSRVVAAVNLALPWNDSMQSLVEEKTAQLQVLGRELSGLLGYQGPYPVIPTGPPPEGLS
ncbi:MAG: helix-turn-helix domain-containing protein [Deltaproteobacteria bacterium]|nr:helix-turn-helix domain-containing protein [Deltaproteobacteria bacterium]